MDETRKQKKSSDASTSSASHSTRPVLDGVAAMSTNMTSSVSSISNAATASVASAPESLAAAVQSISDASHDIPNPLSTLGYGTSLDSHAGAQNHTGGVMAKEKVVVIAFVNSVSGGQKGMDAIKILSALLGEDHVFDLKKDKGPLRGLNMFCRKVSMTRVKSALTWKDAGAGTGVGPKADSKVSTVTSPVSDLTSSLASHSETASEMSRHGSKGAPDPSHRSLSKKKSKNADPRASASGLTIKPSKSKQGVTSPQDKQPSNAGVLKRTPTASSILCPTVRALVCGGDGSFNWVSSKVFEEGFDVALIPVPLGTGNDLARALGWGFKYPGDAAFESIIEIVRTCDEPHWLDLFCIETVKSETEFLEDDKRGNLRPAPLNTNANITPTAPSKKMGKESQSSKDKETDNIPEELLPRLKPLRETFCNYTSIGVDAHVELKFNEGRWKNPEKYNSQLMNVVLHGVHGIRHMAIESKYVLRNIVKYVKVDGRAIDIPSNIQALLFLNITSYGAGSNPWGKSSKSGFDYATGNDGKLEIVGLKSLRHFISVKLGFSGVRLGQGSNIELRIETRNFGPIPMQADGEPWYQEGALLRISHGQHIPTFLGPYHDESMKTSLNFQDGGDFEPKVSIRLQQMASSTTTTQNQVTFAEGLNMSKKDNPVTASLTKARHRRVKSREAEDLPDLSNMGMDQPGMVISEAIVNQAAASSVQTTAGQVAPTVTLQDGFELADNGANEASSSNLRRAISDV